MSSHEVHTLLGPMVVATWLSKMLYPLVIVQTYHYFMGYPSDKLLIKFIVIAIVMLDTLTAVTTSINAYLHLVTYYGDPASLRVKLWPTVVYLTSTAISTAIVQAFMLHRYWILTRRWIVLCFTGLLILCNAVLEIYISIFLLYIPRIPNKDQVKRMMIIGICCCILADMIIAVALSIYFMTRDVEYKRAKRLTRRLSILALQTGSLTAITESLLLLFFALSRSNAYLIIIFCHGHVYSITLLYNLNIRKKLRNRG